MSVVCTCHNFKDNFRTKHIFENYLKESCELSSDEQVSIKYFLNIAFVREILQKYSGGFCCVRHETCNSVYLWALRTSEPILAINICNFVVLLLPINLFSFLMED